MDPGLVVALATVFVAVAFGVGVLAYSVLMATAPERRRLERTAHRAPTGVLGGFQLLSEKPSEFAKRVATFFPRSPRDLTRLRLRVARAGYQTLKPVAVFTLAQVVTPVVLGLTPWFFGSLARVWPLMLVLALVGYLLPGFVLDSKVVARQRVIRNGLPDALDLMIVCLESGSAMDQAILKVSEELALPYPALGEELKTLITETRAGKPRIEAFRSLAERTGVDDVRSLVAILVQTDRFGTSVSKALRAHAETSRSKRRQRAEERAAKIGVKLVFPLVFLLFPAYFVVTIGPAVVRLMRVLFGEILQ